jgi:hypothetical protein
MPNSNRDLKAVVIWTVAMLLVVVTTDAETVLSVCLRVLIAIPLVLLLTGHMILRAIPFTAPSLLEHTVYAVGLSIAACIGGGFVLNAISLLTPLGWAIWFVVITGTTAWIASRRQDDDVMAISVTLPKLQRWHMVVLGLALVIMAGTYSMVLYDEAKDQEFKYTEFWMIPGGPGRMLIGIRNANEPTEKFQMNVTADGELVTEWRSIVIDTGEIWTQEIFTPARAHKVEAKLINDKGLYRRVSVATGIGE